MASMALAGATTSILTASRTTRIYCRPGCPAGKRMKPQNEVFFASAQEARTAGYRPCKVCKPVLSGAEGPDAEPEIFVVVRYYSPLGPYLLVASPQGLVSLEPEEHMGGRFRRWQRDGIRVLWAENPHTRQAAHELDEYFAGQRREFTVPLDLRGTPFQRGVWAALQTIPYGQTCSYRDIAQALGRPTAVRAVGAANGCNPVSIIVPCHRVIGAGGALVGYGGGLDRKEALLILEQNASPTKRLPLFSLTAKVTKPYKSAK